MLGDAVLGDTVPRVDGVVAVRDGAGGPAGFGVYVHVPFCASRCDYCDFATWTDRGHLVDAYVDACVADLHRRYDGHAPTASAPDVPDGDHPGPPPPATTVFFGGGTPSLLPAEALVRILAAVPRGPGAEVTVECNPESVDPAKLAAYRDAGVTRLSFGVQSMVDRVLAALGRQHRRGDVEAAVDAARGAGFTTFNLDLIYGGHGETAADWATTLERTLALDAPHISAYALTVEPGTPLAGRIRAGELDPPDDDVLADRYDRADELLGGAGREWYEISNWARPGHECRHNGLYWAQGDYLGIGCAAHGHTGGRRWWTVRTPERYVERIRAGTSPEAGAERLDPDRRAEERLALAIRTRAGVVVAPDPTVDDELAALADVGLLTSAPAPGGTHVVLTRPGRRLGGELTARLLARGARPAVLALGTLECQPPRPAARSAPG